MRSNSFILQVATGLVAASLFLACSSGAPVLTNDPNGSGGGSGEAGASGQSGSGSGSSSSTGDAGIHIGEAGAAGESGSGCKTTCGRDECGPIADGCGDVIECGGCEAPETCGGGGEPSRCGGSAACVPLSCEDLGASCGFQPDGCGEVLDCWSEAAKASGAEPACEVAGEQCVDGVCEVPSTCDELTCADYDASSGLCGPVSDGCGGTLDCGFTCDSDEICGAEEAGQCGTATCEPLTCEAALAGKPSGYCGYVADGCGGEVQGCVSECSGGETCGGGGVPDVCGVGSSTCVPRTAADCGSVTCGPISDGCGGTVQCGSCTAPQTCGGGGEPGQCGAPACVPRTCAGFGAECGSIPDGCGGTLACGSCGAGEVCNANRCDPVVCVPKTQTEACTGFCGPQSDGCGGVIDCGGCTAPNTCGGGGTPSVCGAPACTPLTCADVGANCGPIGDGCGGIVASCGTCTAPDTCGGGGVASQCGNNGNPCTGLCQNQVSCTPGQETRLTGTVHAPNGTEPIYNALVYVPNAPLPAVSAGPSCDRCEDEDLGSPIASTITGPDGSFVLRDVPAGVDFPLVVKIGKWRRVVTIPAVQACTNVDLSVDQARLPRNMTDASAANRAYLNIPRMAMVTGDVDELECVLRKIGVSDSEFTMPSGSGRIHLYRANGAYAGCTNFRSNGHECRSSGAIYAPLSSLFSGSTLDNYDVAIFGCEGSENEHNGYDPALRSWADSGGRVFASHYSYTYLHDNGNFASTATWGGPWRNNDAITTGILDTSFAKGQAFNSWLGATGANHPIYGSGYIEIQDPRDYVQSVAAGTERFVYTDDDVIISGTQINKQDAVQQYSFNTPVGADAENVCGRVLYSAFHVANASDNNDEVFPLHCSNQPLTPQEKVLEFMLFDLSSCVSTGDPPSCTPNTCAGLGANCGAVADGCGGLLDCGTCSAPDICGGAGVPNQCGTGCTQTTCGAQGANCGIIADGCGGQLSCGDCTPPAGCGAGGTPNVCGVPQCQPRTCADVGAECGAISDGCGDTVECGDCTSGTCGGGGTPNVCGAGSCNPATCASAGAECGFIGDGCGGTVNCGTCPDNGICGGAGPNLCGPSCTPRTCADAGAQCGFIGDGCGGVLNCGTCLAPQVCGGGGVPSQCGGGCTPRTCADAGAQCGAISDGCGGVLQCGTCPAGSTCGGGGVANQCGTGTCTPRTCAQAGAECGAIGDGCGGVLQCGTCVAPESCGGAGTPNHCDPGGCVPLTCQDQNADCGPVADGCGGLLDCGTCTNGKTCGGGGTPSRCGGGVE